MRVNKSKSDIDLLPLAPGWPSRAVVVAVYISHCYLYALELDQFAYSLSLSSGRRFHFLLRRVRSHKRKISVDTNRPHLLSHQITFFRDYLNEN